MQHFLYQNDTNRYLPFYIFMLLKYKIIRFIKKMQIPSLFNQFNLCR